MTDPLVIEFEVAAPREHAFTIWTERCLMWWPADHTLTRNPAEIVFEPHTGGRIFERASDGTEHDWGVIVEWNPPEGLTYSWHLFFDPSEATEITVTFRATGPAATTVRLEQRGWERLGDAGAPRRTRTGQVWTQLSRRFSEACAASY